MQNVFTYWWALAMISGAGLATRNLLFKVVNSKLDTPFAALVLSVGMTVVVSGYFIWQRLTTQTAFIPAGLDKKAVILCLVAGAGVAFANIFLSVAYKAGGYASLVAILQNGFAITVTVLLGALLLGEHIRPLQFVGILTAFAGIAMIVRG